MPAEHQRRRPLDGWILLGVASVGLLAALALPFAPVLADLTTLTWPAPGEPAKSSTVQLTPYRPNDLSATVPCSAVAAGLARDEPTTILATAPDAEGLVLRTENGRLLLLPGNREIDVGPTTPDCALTIRADANGIQVSGSTTTTIILDEPVPQVFAFRTALNPAEALGLTVAVHVDSPFATSPTPVKLALAAVALASAAIALLLLQRISRPLPTRGPPDVEECSSSRWKLRAVDVGVIVLMCGWAVIGPLAVDDGWATTIARNVAATGNPGNYYRWWDAPESPFAFGQELLALLTQFSLAPLWLRLPSTLLALATWFVLSRGVFGAALPSYVGSVRVRLVAALFFAVAWLPFNLGTRPESYVALGLAAVLALAWRARTPAALGWIVLVCALTAPISPTAVMLAAPVVAFSPRLVGILRSAATGKAHLAGLVGLLCCVGAVSIVILFVDQTWEGLAIATRWHTEFGPTLPWYREPDRYTYLLGDGQQGSAAKRAPVLLALASVPVVVALAARRVRGSGTSSTPSAALRLAGIVVGALLLLAVVPSKWSYHLGGAAALFAVFLTAAVVAMMEFAAAKRVDRWDVVLTAVGAVMTAAAIALVFTGTNAWWLPAVYDVPWAQEAIRPLGVPLDSFWLWLAVAIIGLAACALVRRSAALLATPAVVTLLAAGILVALLVGSFVAAPIRRPTGSLAMVNVHQLTGGPYCGLADSIEVLADGAPLLAAGPTELQDGFVSAAGFDPDVPPPDAPGTGMSTALWGSRTGIAGNVGNLVSPWFALPAGTSVAVSVNGRVDGPNRLSLEFGRADAEGVVNLADVTPVDPPSTDDNSLRPAWRTIGVDAAQIPTGADRVRIRAVDGGASPGEWLAVTGPRTSEVMPLNTFLAGRSPILVSWPLAFLFPCIHDIPVIADGIAQVPRVVLKAPGSWFTEPTDQSIGGSFTSLPPYGRFYEVRSRIVGHPDLDWGAVLVSADTTDHDVYERQTVQVVQPGGSR